MLDVQKAALTNRMRQRLVAIRERELDYYTSNCRLLGNQAALVAGFAYSGIRCAPHHTAHSPASPRRAWLLPLQRAPRRTGEPHHRRVLCHMCLCARVRQY